MLPIATYAKVIGLKKSLKVNNSLSGDKTIPDIFFC